MNILIVNTFYYPKSVGGAEISVQLLAEGLVRSDNRVFVLTLGDKRSVCRVNGVTVIRVKQQNIYSIYHNRKRSGLLKSIWHLVDSYNPLNYFLNANLLDRIKPDIVHTNNIQGFSPSIWTVIKRKGLPLAHTLRDYYLVCHKCTMYQSGLCEKLCLPCKASHGIKKRFVHHPDCYIGVSRFILEKHREYYPMDSQQKRVIYNPIRMPAFVSGTAEPDKKKITFGFIGRISQAKGAGYLARELGKLPGELKSRIRMLFAGKGEEDYIRSIGQYMEGLEYAFLGTAVPADFYNKIDVLIVPSLWNEPFGRIVIEALAYSVPVCLAGTGGLAELYDPACTWKFSPSENRLSELVTYLSRNTDEIKNKKNACRPYAANFSEKGHVQNYIQAYMQTIVTTRDPAGATADQTDGVIYAAKNPGRPEGALLSPRIYASEYNDD